MQQALKSIAQLVLKEFVHALIDIFKNQVWWVEGDIICHKS
jgi:hypothetical protein